MRSRKLLISLVIALATFDGMAVSVSTDTAQACNGVSVPDVSAKELARTAQTAAETIATDNGESYSRVNRKTLHKVEPSIIIVRRCGDAWLSAASGTSNSYSVTATSPTGRRFTIKRNANGAVLRRCAPSGGGCSRGRW
jgi:hypothetical protein